MRRLIHFATLSGDVETDQRLAGSWDTRHETNDLALLCPRLIHQFFYSKGRDSQILGPSVETRDRLDRMLRIKGPCRFNDGRRRMIRGARPKVLVKRLPHYRSQS